MKKKTIQERVEDLVRQMTLAEKVGQMNQIFDISEKHLAEVRAGRIGSSLFAGGIWGGSARDGAIRVDHVNAIQKVAVEESRLGIPILFGRDVIHGFRTIQPIPLGQAATWDPALIERGARQAAVEARAAGLHWTFAPMLDIARDPRWGRIAEGYGEDPHLCSVLGRAAVRGFQGDNFRRPDGILCTAKHYVAYGGAEGGRDYNTVDLSERTLQDIYLPSFKAAIDEGVRTVMSSFNEIGGIPGAMNHHTLTEILKEQWGFQGVLFSDWQAIAELVNHGVAADLKDAAAKSVNAGMDMDMISHAFIQHLEALVNEGRVAIERVDDAVRRILTVKFEAGVFDRPYAHSTRHRKLLLCAEHRAVARDMAARSVMLLKNANGLLPLPKTLRNLAVVGPMAQSKGALVGCWAMDAIDHTVVSVTEGIRAKVPNMFLWSGYGETDQAVCLAMQGEVIVAVVGEHPQRSGESNNVSTLDLPAGHLEYLQALKAFKIPLVVVVLAGRPLSIKWLLDNADAVLYAWHPGIEGGHAIADVLFGDVNPSAKTPVTFPRTVGQVPWYYNHKPTGRPLKLAERGDSRYVDLPNSPLLPFGYGLSYTTFAYSQLKVTPRARISNGVIKISAKVKNTGARAGEEIVQLYVRDHVAQVTRPVKELKAFTRVSLKPGQAKVITFTLKPADLAYTGADLQPVVDPGTFTLWVGPNSAEGLSAEFTLV